MPVPPYHDHWFLDSDWGGSEAAYEAAKALFNKLRADNSQVIVDALRGAEPGWFVREPSRTPILTRVRP